MEKILKYVLCPLLLLFIVFTPTSSEAQFGESAPTIEQINTRKKELEENEKKLPDNDLILYDESRNIDEELARYENYLRTLKASEGVVGNFDKVKETANKVIKQVDELNCNTANRNILDSILKDIRSVRNELISFDVSDNPWDFSTGRNANVNASDTPCQALKEIFNDQAKRQELIKFIDDERSKLVKIDEENKIMKEQVNLVIPLLQNRKTNLQNKLNSKDPQLALSNNLWLVIVAIGVVSILTIMAVKLFSEPLQVEWVASGQVIQFVTVMILLSVIMGLGVTNVLKENTLGTLLGGLASYVLSQGVGRAAAREATRRLNNPRATDSDTQPSPNQSTQ